MALERHILPSSYPSHPPPHLEILRLRQPLQDSAGNAQHNHMLASSNSFNGHKGIQPRIEQNSNLRFSLPTLPSQRDPQSVSSQLERRRASNRAVRSMRTGHRNPIIDSPQYQAYRDRQPKSSQKDQKWPDDLEEAFLDGMCSMLQYVDLVLIIISASRYPKDGEEKILHKQQATRPK
jgi:transcriptional enhancer factor